MRCWLVTMTFFGISNGLLNWSPSSHHPPHLCLSDELSTAYCRLENCEAKATIRRSMLGGYLAVTACVPVSLTKSNTVSSIAPNTSTPKQFQICYERKALKFPHCREYDVCVLWFFFYFSKTPSNVLNVLHSITMLVDSS